MAEEIKRTDRKARSLRSAANGQDSADRSANKARSYRAETYQPADPDRPAPETIYLNTTPRETSKESKTSSPFERLREKYDEITTAPASGSGSSYKRRQAQKARVNDLMKKGIIGLIILVILVLAIVLIINSTRVSNVGTINISSTATTQTLSWSGARKGLSYEVYRAEGANGEYQLLETLSDGENTKTYDNLTAGTLYRYKIVTVKSNGEKTDGTESEAYTKPNAVTSTSAVTTAQNALSAVWSLQGSTASYELKYSLYDNLRDATTLTFSSEDATYNSSTDSYSYEVGDLVEGQTYYMSLRTVCADSASEWSPVFSGIVSDSFVSLDVDTSQPMVALTFDGGPDGGTVTERILNTLALNNSKATFFQTGVNAELYPDLMKRIVNEGHEMGNHTYDESHVGGEVTADDILAANTSIEAACSVSPKLFRAPQGDVTDAIRDTCESAGMSIILFNFDSHDWEIYDPDEIVERIQTYVEDGDIIQFRNIYDETADAIDVIVPYLIEQGYQLVTVTDLIQTKTGSVPLPGKVYRSAYEHE